MTKNYFFLFLSLAISPIINAQTTLASGDIAFIMINATDNTLNSALNDDNISFVLLKNVATGTKISFTDYGWRSDAAAFQTANSCGANTGSVTDGVVTWTATSALPYGTTVHLNVRNNLSASVGTITGTSAAYNSTISAPLYYVSLSSVAGESVIAFQGTSASPTLITAIRLNTTWSTSLSNCDYTPSNCVQPSTLSGTGLSFLWGQVGGNGKLKSSVTLTGTKTTDLANIYNVANWDFNTTVAFSLSNVSTLGNTSFQASNFDIYPNPTTDEISIQFNNEFQETKYTIYDLIGRSLFIGNLNKKEEKISLEKLNKGVYLIEFNNNQGKFVEKIIKE
jgi:hypothetical protein